MSDIVTRLRNAAQPGAFVETTMLVEAAEHVEKLERIVFDKLDQLTITPSPAKKPAAKSNTRKTTT